MHWNNQGEIYPIGLRYRPQEKAEVRMREVYVQVCCSRPRRPQRRAYRVHRISKNPICYRQEIPPQENSCLPYFLLKKNLE